MRKPARRVPARRRPRARALAPAEPFTRIFDASPVAIALASWEDGNLLEVNDAWVEMVGIPRSEAVGRNASELGVASPELRAEFRARLERGERVHGIPHEFTTRSGERRHNLLSLVRVEVAGRPCLLAFALDMTDRRRVVDDLVASEQRYHLLVERNPLPMWVYDRETLRILGVNEAAVLHLGYSRDEFRRMTVLDLRPPEERPRLAKEVEDIEGYRFSGRWKLRKKDGALIDVEILSHDMPFAERPARVVLANDVTARLLGEERLRRSYAELRALTARLERIREEESRRIAREVHDEVGQALTAIKIDLVEAERALTEAGGAPEPALRRLAGIGRLLDDTLDVVHRISTELRPGVLDELGLETAVEWQLEEFRKRTGISCRFASDLGGTPIDGGRSTAVFRVLQELLTNVARHAQAHEVSARLGVEAGALVFDLADDGRGIPARAVTAPQSFGLAGIRERVAQFDGRVTIRGANGRGTRVKVVIPL